MAVARMLREDFLQQSAFDEVDRFSPLDKTYWMLKAIMAFYRLTRKALEARVPLERVIKSPVVADIARMKELHIEVTEREIKSLLDRVRFSFEEMGVR